MAGVVGNPYDPMAAVRPRTGPPVQNMGGIPKTTAVAPPKPFVTSPKVKAGPPGPTPQANAQTMFGSAAVQPAATTQPIVPGGAPPGGVRAPGAGTAMPVGKVSPAPAPAAPAVPAPVAPAAPAPAAAAPGGGATTPEGGAVYGPGGGSSAAPGSIEDQIRGYISGAMKGSVTPEFINRAKQGVFRNVSGQTKQAVNRVNQDAVSRGLFKSGIPAESVANIEGQSQSAIASGVADILNNAENTNIQGRQAAAGTAGNLLASNREWDQYSQQRADAAAARAAAGAPKTFTYIDPDTGQSYEMDESWF